jgi:hypothetical protein
MIKQKLVLYSKSDIVTQSNLIRHNNAFIMQDGSFYLAKGYTDCNPSHQLESSALAIARKDIAYDIRLEYNSYLDKLKSNQTDTDENIIKRFYYLRSILVHYYGYALFARTELIKSYKERNVFCDQSLIPDPEYYGKSATSSQIETLERLFEINDDGTLYVNYYPPITSKDILQKVLNHKNNSDNWHH